MPRPRRDTSRVQVNIENDVLAEMELYLHDPVKGKMQYGALSNVINLTLRAWLKKIGDPNVKTEEFLQAYGINLRNT